MKLKYGEYVRIKHMYNETKIAKIIRVLEKDPCYKNMQMYQIDVIHQKSNGHFPSYKIYQEDIIKHSFNIIDLIEVGDYVNGEQVVGKDNNCILVLTDKGQTFLRNIFEEKEIKSILTKEQIKQIEYRIEE